MPSEGDQSPPPPPPAPAEAAGSEEEEDEEEEEEEDDDGEAEDSAQPTRTPTPQTQQRFDELCCRLNMDEAARAEAWDSYRSMSESYTLEGNDLHWLACALYVACRKSVPTVSKGTAEGNYVSLTRLLRCSEQSLIEFFNKMKKWEEMANLPQDFRERTERLERNFTVSAVIFKKYEPIFQDIFKYPQEEQPRQQRGRKQRRQPCTVSEIFHFCWVLFIYAKGNFPMISDDLVNSYHLLLCALDLVYGNALQCSNRKDLVNPNFKGLSEDFHAKDFKPSSDPPCVIEKLCSLHEGLVLEAKGIKEHFWKPYIRKLYEKKLLKGKEENLTGFLEPGNFGENLKAISKAYEEYVLTVGNLDERVFLGEDADEDIGPLSRSLSAGAGAERAQVKSVLQQQQLDKSKGLRISTPLTGVRYIKDNSSPCVTPVSAATHSLSRLHTMLAGLRNTPSERLGQILRTCSRDPTQAIANRLKEMYEIYSQHSQPDEDLGNCAKEIASRHFRFAEMLYYKVLESIIEQEQKRLGDMDLSSILEQDAFHRSLLACCLEVVTFSYKPPGNFPFITEIFEVPLYHFYKVIEVFIRAEDGLCREVVKHLNQIEEQILDHLAWKPDSPLWDRIRENDSRVPACEEVMPAQNLERADDICMAGSPLTPRRVSEVRADAGGVGRGISSPATLYDRYSSPAASSTRRRLFVDSDSPSERGVPGRLPPQPLVSAVPVQSVPGEAVPVTPVPGQTLVPMATATVTANNGQTVTIPVQGIANENGGITFFPVQVNVGGQAQAVPGSMQPLSAQALAGNLGSQPVPGAALQVPGPVALPQLSPGGQQKPAPPGPGGSSGRPRKTSSLSLFFRKVYHLAGVRLRDLCAKLDISDELRKKIWTCFEFSIIQCPELMMDRHLDQLLMCAIYVMAKVTKEDKSFQNIMRCYRTQPQARSQVYRSVLIRGKRKRRNSGSSESRSHQNSPTELNKDRTSRDSSPVMRSSSTLPVPQPSSAPPTPTHLTGANSDLEEEERGDLIQFYNNVYVKQIQTFALKYSQANVTDAPPLSPYPFVRAGSPRRVQLSQNHPVYISPHKHEIMLSPREKIFYYFSNSPSKRLREINSMIRTGETPTKKRGILLEDGSESPAKRICPENHTALLRRLQDVANDRGSH
ncbi:retinoblastoma-like protein 2 isoform X1 [Pipistrellus kuhlii]|uniref:Retinoblastoma-like protein 2 n=2 Tax=Pipistrellus kuhlii TaxID=59472 RepID=A0A7J7V1K1_PIPKU|nr:retinoblastoma-like protein 2 isoform X1 [Pipistrellus kuhlii]XP_045438817.1 retinoblastoma-like protein 2 isoform X1 [Pipistrellus kuhlii]KAF6318856.1 RB transcriptional corepressor like 2 [Pipistrellus kuhlii]